MKCSGGSIVVAIKNEITEIATIPVLPSDFLQWGMPLYSETRRLKWKPIWLFDDLATSVSL